jgi:5'-3' exonuclease
VKVHLIDGTYELFRQYFGAARAGEPGPTDGVIGVLSSTLMLLNDGATHIGVATDHVIESFRNDLWAGYKTGEGMDPILLAQIPLLEEAMVAMGVTTWAMVEYEADDALGAAAAVAARDERVEQVIICTPDKDLGQCIVGDRVVQLDRRKGEITNEAGVVAKFGVGPNSIADYLGLVGDTADGFPGLPGWGAKSASAVLAKFGKLENIPLTSAEWGIPRLRGAEKLAATLRDQLDMAYLFRTVATIDCEVPVGNVDEWKWAGPTEAFAAIAESLGQPALNTRATRLAAKLA